MTGNAMMGRLFLVATPIGNLGDMSVRAVETLKAADLIAAEDTRNSIKLLNHFDIHVPMTSYHEYNKFDKGKYLVEKMQEGLDVALITDAGTPGISDPGEELVKMCIEAGIEISPIPGAAACVSALIVSGFSTRRFCFEGFLPRDKKEQKIVLDRLKTETRTTVFYEAPHRLLKTLALLEKAAGGDRRVAVCRELTKKHETVNRTTLSDAISYYTENSPRGEIVLVLDGASRQALEEAAKKQWNNTSVEDHMKIFLDQGMDRKEAMKRVAAERGVARRDIYNYLVGKKTDI